MEVDITINDGGYFLVNGESRVLFEKSFEILFAGAGVVPIHAILI